MLQNLAHKSAKVYLFPFPMGREPEGQNRQFEEEQAITT
jgi:hypothetical protein